MPFRGGRDFRELRDDLRFERQYEIRRRREGGADLEGGQSEAQIAVASTTGLAETETIALSAVNAFTVVVETNDINLAAFSGVVVSVSTDLTTVDFIAGAHPLLIQFHDMFRGTVDPGTTDQVTVTYTMTVFDSTGIAVADPETGLSATVTREVLHAFGPTFGYASLFADRAMSDPDLVLLVNGLTEGLHYSIEVTFGATRQSAANDDVIATSYERILTLQEVKR